MAVTLTVSGDISKITRHLNEVQKRVIPAVAIQALNEVARTARSEGTKAAAKALRLPQKYISKRFDVHGSAKEDRILYTRANRSNMAAVLSVYHRGIPISQIATRQDKRGVRARGGRLYEGAFLAKGLAFKRRGKARLPVMVPRVAVRRELLEAFGSRMTGAEGKRRFVLAFNSLLTKRLAALRV